MSGCTIQSNKTMKKWTIDPKALEKLYPLLYKHTETGGKFTFPVNKKGVVKRITSVKNIETTNGNSDSVRAPEGLANFHTHPFSCYVSEDTVYGSFSGEDIRETVLFAMKGSLVHLVLAIEGVYSLQVNPCVLSNFMHIEPEIKRNLPHLKKCKKTILKIFNQYTKQLQHPSYDLKPFLESKGIKSVSNYINNVKTGDEVYLIDFLSDVIRGIIVLYIEIYFRASHRFRAHDINVEDSLFPIDFVKFVNAFKISNIFNTNKKIKGCGNLSCGGVPVYEDGRKRSSKFSKYVCEYEKETHFYLVNKRGETYSLDLKLSNLMKLSKCVKKLNISKQCTGKDNKLGTGKDWFRMTFTPNYINFKGKEMLYISKRLNADQRKQFVKYWSEHIPSKNETPVTLKKAPVFYYYTLKGDCDHTDINEHLINTVNFRKTQNNLKNPKIVLYGSKRCGWCKRAVKSFENKGIKITKRYFDSIDSAVDNASRYSIKYGGPELDSIPAIFVDTEYKGGYNSVKKIIKNVSNN